MAQRFVTEFVINGDSSSGVQATRSLQRAQTDLTREMQNAERQNQAVSASFDTVAVRARHLATVSAATTAALGAMAVTQTQAIAEQAALARSVGVSVQTLQEWEFAAKSVNMGAGQMGDIFKDTAEKIGDFVATGGGEAADLFERLNLDINRLMSLRPDEQLLAIGAALDGVATQGEKIFFMESLANDASRLLPLLENNAAALRDQIAIADQIGITVPQSDIDSIEQASQAINELTAMGTGFANAVAAEWAPGIVQLSEIAKEVVEYFGGMGGVVEDVTDGTMMLSGILAGRLVGALATATMATGKKMSADRAAGAQALVVAQQEERRTAAELKTATTLRSRALAETKATAGTNAHGLALQNLTAASARATAAQQAHTAATNATAVAADRASVSARMMAGSLALVGGPAGAAMLAGAAAYYFRDSLGFTSAAARETRQEIDDLVGSLESYTQAQYETNRVSIVQNLAEARIEAEKLAQQILELQDQSREEGVIYQGRGGAASAQLAKLRAELQEQQRLVRAGEEGLRTYDQTWQDVLESQVSGVSIFRTLDQWLMKSGDSLDTFNASLGESGAEWDEYLGKLTSARDTLGMTAAEAAAYAAQQEGYTGLYADQAAAVAGQTDALNSYRQAVASGNAEEAAAHLERATRYAEAEAMVQAQLANMATLTGLLQGVQTELSAVALTSALSVADGAGAGADYVAQAIKAINERAAAIQRTTTVTIQNTAASRDADKAAQEAKRAADQLVKSYESQVAQLEQEIALFGETGDAAKLRYELEHGALQGLAPEQKEHLLGLREELDLKERQAKTVEDFKQKTDDLIGTYDRQSQQAKKLQADLEAINAAYRDPAIDMSREQYERMIAEINHQQYMLAMESETTFGAMATAWERSIERMDDAGVDFWRGFLDGTGSALDQFKNIVLDSVAEVAHALITRPLMVNLQTQIAGGMGFGPGGQQGAGGGFGLNNLGSLKTGYQALKSGFGGIQWGGVSTGYSGGFAGNATAGLNTATQGTSYLGGSMRNFSGMQGLGSMGAGYAGGQIGTKLGASVFGKEAGSSFGATAGAAIGTYFGGPIGAFAGGTIGGALDSLFGSGKKTFDFDFAQGGNYGVFGDRQSALGQFGITSFSDYKLEQQPELDALLNGIVDLDNAIAAAALPERFDAIKASIAGFAHDGPEDLVESRLRAMIAGSGSAMADAVMQIADPQKLATGFLNVLQLEQVGAQLGSAVMNDIIAEVNRQDTASGVLDASNAMQAAAQAALVLRDASSRLNLQFDANTDGAIHAASRLQSRVGGGGNLDSLLSGYYDAFYTEAEKFEHLTEDLTQAFADMGRELPSTRQGVRDVVESLALAGNAGQDQLATVLELSGPLSRYIATMEQQGSAAGEASEALDGNTNALQRQAEIAREAENIQRQIWQLQGDTTAIRRAELDALHPANRALKERFYALQDEADAAQRAAQAQQDLLGGVQGAWQSLTQSVNAERQILESAYRETTASINANIERVRDGMAATERTAQTLTSTLDRMAQQEMGLASSRADAQGYLQQVLASGGLGDPDKLDEALGVVAQPSEGLFSSFGDYQRDFWKTANVIAELNDRADGQLTTEQRTLAALERQLTTAEQQHDRELSRLDGVLASEAAQLEAMFGQQSWLETINGSVLSLGDALRALEGAKATAATPRDSYGKPLLTGESGPVADLYRNIFGRDPDAAGLDYWRGRVADGASLDDVRRSFESSSEKLPKFRDGGIASGPMSGYQVELHGTEAVIPLQNGPVPLRIESSNQQNPLLEELRLVTQRLEGCERQLEEANSINVAIAEHNAKLASETERMRRKAEQEGA
ncbi:DUF4214 domain-containing protein [Halomonas sp. HMF6819]|uniref:DUF4214 domain-containing protein n=1 Tax=Halomonas sp. HMF6819 TaxID=3373085 RepID=UPI0037B7DB9B